MIVWLLRCVDWSGSTTPSVHSTPAKAIALMGDVPEDAWMRLEGHQVDGGQVAFFTSRDGEAWKGGGPSVTIYWTGSAAELIAGEWKGDAHLAEAVTS